MSKCLSMFSDREKSSEYMSRRTQAVQAYNSQVAAARAAGLPDPPEFAFEPPPAATPVVRCASLNEEALRFSRAVDIKGDWPALTRAYACFYLRQLGAKLSLRYESQVLNTVDDCVTIYERHKQRHLRKTGVQLDDLQAQLGLYRASADSRKVYMWNFSSAVAATTCVRLVIQAVKFPVSADGTAPAHYAVVHLKEDYAKKRPRPPQMRGSPSAYSKIKAARFTQISGVAEASVAACMDLMRCP